MYFVLNTKLPVIHIQHVLCFQYKTYKICLVLITKLPVIHIQNVFCFKYETDVKLFVTVHGSSVYLCSSFISMMYQIRLEQKY